MISRKEKVDENESSEDTFRRIEKQYGGLGYSVERNFSQTLLTGDTLAKSTLKKGSERLILTMVRKEDSLDITTSPDR